MGATTIRFGNSRLPTCMGLKRWASFMVRPLYYSARVLLMRLSRISDVRACVTFSDKVHCNKVVTTICDSFAFCNCCSFATEFYSCYIDFLQPLRNAQRSSSPALAPFAMPPPPTPARQEAQRLTAETTHLRR